MDKLPLSHETIRDILAQFGLETQQVTNFCDSSRGEGDVRWNFMVENVCVLKINSATVMWEARLQEIDRLIGRYREIGLSCPRLIPTLAGPLSCPLELAGAVCTCFVEEYAEYPVCTWDDSPDRKEVVAHLGTLAARFTNVDLSKIHSMWSIIDLAPFDGDVDEKQENADQLTEALRESGFTALADRVAALNAHLRQTIERDFRALPRCVYQGDLNSTNELQNGGHFAGLIDFNASGTDVNINVFLNETNCFPTDETFARLSVPQMLEKMAREQDEILTVIWRQYAMNPLERKLLPYFRRLIDLFQYPNVCQMTEWLADAGSREKCADLIEALVDQPL